MTRYNPSMFPDMPPRGEVSEETIRDFVRISEEIMEDQFAELDNHHLVWEQAVEEIVEAHRKRVRRIKLWAFQKRTGLPF